MTYDSRSAPGDPSRPPTSAASRPWGESTLPAVASSRRGRDLWLVVGGAILHGLLVLFWLGARRTAAPAHRQVTGVADVAYPAPGAPTDLVDFQTSSRRGLASGPAAPPPAVPLTALPISSAPALAPLPAPAPANNALNVDPRLRAPAMVVDLGDTAAAASAPASAASIQAAKALGIDPQTAAALAAAGAGPASSLNSDERFAQRVGAEEPERARATMLRNQSQTVPQGALIAGVLETALNSDLPGFARAVVSRDVRGFDGSTVLIPRGSRVIGQYKSAVAQGQSRAFVIWTRILRPDGVSIQIGSSATDPLGRAGLAGKVNRHFLEEFSGSILLSVIDAEIASIAGTPSTQVVIGSAQQATSLASSAFLPTAIPPTIKVPQGAPIRIFVARDLDFSSAG